MQRISGDATHDGEALVSHTQPVYIEGSNHTRLVTAVRLEIVMQTYMLIVDTIVFLFVFQVGFVTFLRVPHVPFAPNSALGSEAARARGVALKYAAPEKIDSLAALLTRWPSLLTAA
jgi:hypothetical protein